MKAKTIRNSNFEIMRIICMIMIIGFHCMQHSAENDFSLIRDSEISFNLFFSIFIGIWGSVATLAFVALTSYFMVDSNKKIHFDKIVKIVFQCWGLGFIAVIGSLLVGRQASTLSVIKILLTPLYPQYSFITTWIVFYLSIPFLAKLVECLSVRELRHGVAVFTFLVPIYNTLWNNVGGHLLSFYYMYFFIALSRKDEKVSKFFDRYSKRCWIFGSILLLILVSGSKILEPIADIPFFSITERRLFRFYNPLIYFLAISLFYTFKGLKVKNSRCINKIASGTFGVYIFHECIVLREGNSLLWNQLFHIENAFNNSVLYPFYVIIAIFIVWVISTLISITYSQVVDLLFEDSRKYKGICRKIDSIINTNSY